MHIKHLSIVNFKNYDEVSLDLHNRVNCFVGNNGVGKTNLLDAVHYLCMCKSYFQGSDLYTIRHEQEFMVLQGKYFKHGEEMEIYCGLKNGKRKIFRKNKKEYPRLSDHIGQFPVVMVSPLDSSLILDGGEERRRYMNAVISQFNHDYLEATIQYNKLVIQRNKFLKEQPGRGHGSDLLDVYDQQLAPLGMSIHEQRNKFVEQLSPIFQDFYSKISNGNELVSLRYNSQLSEKDYSELLMACRTKDCMVQHTSCGVHKDDLELLMDNVAIKKIGSQGQQKTFLLALKLAQFKFISEVKKVAPILLLDDIFDKFDQHRVREILNIVSSDNFGQIFITHTNELRMKEMLQEFEDNYALFLVDNKKIKPVDHEKK